MPPIETVEQILSSPMMQKYLGISLVSLKALHLTFGYRDRYTAKHQLNVSTLASEVAKHLQFSERDHYYLLAASVLHDIGKIGVPQELLVKPGKLYPEELILLKLHVQISASILQELDFPEDFVKIVGEHHERINGAGYPKGLKGAELSLLTQVLGICDVSEAMLEARPYKHACSMETTLKELSQDKYDQELIKKILPIVEQRYAGKK